MLVIEDLHWADEALLDFLDHLVDWAADVPLLVVCTARPELLAHRPGWAGGKPNATTIASLAPLSEADTARLVAALLNQALLPAETQAALLARAGGNPLYAEEYVRMLADRGFLRRAGSGPGGWKTPSELPLPERCRASSPPAWTPWPPRTRRCCRTPPCSARSAGWAPWPPSAAAEPSALEQRLHTLERRELLRRERRSAVAGERQYAFRHVLVRDVAYGQLPAGSPGRQAPAGRRVAGGRWPRTGPRTGPSCWPTTGRPPFSTPRPTGQDTTALAERARLALREAGDRALELNAFAAAARWYAAALELWPAGRPGAAAAAAPAGTGPMHGEQAGGELLAEARDGLLAIGDREAAAEAEAMLGKLAWLAGTGRAGDGARPAGRRAACGRTAFPSESHRAGGARRVAHGRGSQPGSDSGWPGGPRHC